MLRRASTPLLVLVESHHGRGAWIALLLLAAVIAAACWLLIKGDASIDDGAAAVARAQPSERTGDHAARAPVTVERVVAESGSRATQEDEDADNEPWTLRVQPILADADDLPAGRTVLDAMLVYDSGERDVVAALEFVGQALTMTCRIPRGAVDRATFVMANAPEILQADDGRVLFGESLARRGGLRLADAAEIDRERRVIEIGSLELAPPTHLGRVVFEPPLASDVSIFVGVGAPPASFVRTFESRGLGRRTVVPAGRDAVTCSTFVPSNSWFATVRDVTEDELFFGSDSTGTDLVVEIQVERAIELSVDAGAYPTASRVLVVPADVEPETVLLRASFRRRLQAALRSVLVPEDRDDVVRFGALDCQADHVRVELWSGVDDDGRHNLLESRYVVTGATPAPIAFR